MSDFEEIYIQYYEAVYQYVYSLCFNQEVAKDITSQTFFKAINQSLDGFARRVSVPTLLVYGEKDSDTPLWIAKRYRRLIKGSGLVVIDGCGHFCFLEKPKFFAAVLKSFLES